MKVVCAWCKKTFDKALNQVLAYPNHYCSSACRAKGVQRKFQARAEVRFWARVIKTSSIKDCWPWHKKPNGKSPYPWVGIRSVQEYSMPAHCAAFFFANGHKAKGMVCHKCNNPLCCNPKHLYDGTHKTNYEDSVACGSFVPLARRLGEDVKSSKLTNNHVIEIRQKWGCLPRGEKMKFAAKIGVHPDTCCRAYHKQTWSHLSS